jgi:hypothetical protein
MGNYLKQPKDEMNLETSTTAITKSATSLLEYLQANNVDISFVAIRTQQNDIAVYRDNVLHDDVPMEWEGYKVVILKTHRPQFANNGRYPRRGTNG